MADHEVREQTIARGNAAERLLENKVLHEAYNDTLQSLFAQFLQTDGVADDERRHIHACAKGLNLLKATLEAYVNEGTLEKANRKMDADLEATKNKQQE